MGYQVKLKIVWLPMEEVKPPKDWTLPFTVRYQEKEYKITGADLVDQLWKAEEIC
jgi:hypothetical protein